MGRLVALAAPAGPELVDRIQAIWDAGDAVAPLDPRLPPSERDRVVTALDPHVVIDADHQRIERPGAQSTDDGDALVIATSGTSGTPKGVVHTHKSIAASGRATSAALAVDPDRDRWLCCLPTAHIGGLSVILRAMVTGTPVEVHPQFDPDAVVDAARRGATLTSLVTRALHQIPSDAFRTILLGGAAPPLDRPANTVATYGMTETGSGVVYQWPPTSPDGRRRQEILDGCEVRIDTGRAGPADGNQSGDSDQPGDGDQPGAGDRPGDGEILLRGPMLFRGYRDGTNPFTADRWFPTGDLGRWTDDGRLVVLGRRGDVIVTGGEKVWPEPVERLLLTRDDVAEAAVIGRPDPEWGHRVTAVIVVPAGMTPPPLAALRDTIRTELPAWAAPKAVEVVDALPRTALGKIRRQAL
jgi:O-succinylbenzoic acid--CoA ligase